MAVNVALQNPNSGEIKFIKVGFSWTLFFFSTVLGIPLFARKLFRWGFTMLAINIAAVVFPLVMTHNAAIMNQVMILVGQTVLSFVLGIKGNEITAKHCLAHFWRFTEPQSDAARYAKMKWKIFDRPDLQTNNGSTSAPAAPL